MASEEKERFEKLLKRDGTNPLDMERKAFFFVIGSNMALYHLTDELYDFKERMIKPECFVRLSLSTGLHDLIELAYNLYNNYPSGTICEVFSSLDPENRRLAIEAIKLRFGIK